MFYQKKEKQFKYAIKKKKGGGGAASFIIGAVFLGIGLISYPSVTFADEATELNSSNQIQSNLVKSDSEEINSEENQNKNVLSEDSSTKENIELDTQMSLSESEKQSDVEKRNQKVTNPSENNVNVQTEVPIEINSEELTNSDTTQELDSNFYEGDSTNTLVEENALENTEENEESSTSKEEKNFESVSDVQEDSINAEEDELSKETVIPKEQQLDEEGSTTTPEDNTSSPLVQNPSSRSIDEQSEDVYLADWSFPDNYKIVKRLITQTGITYVGVSQDDPTQLHLKMAYRSAATPVSIDWIYLRIDPELAKYIEEINIKNTVNIGAQVGYQRYFEKVDANSLSDVNTFGNQTGISDAYAQVDQSTGAIYRVLLDKFFTRIPGTKPKDRGALSGNWGVFPSTPLEAERYEANIFIKLSKDVTELQQELGRDKFGVQLRLQGQSSSGVVNIAKESLNKNTIIDLSQEEPDVNNSNWLNSPSVHTITTTYEGKQMGSDGQFSNVLEGTDKSLIRVQNTIMNNLLYGTALDLGRPVSFNIEIDPQILNLVSDDDFITIWQVYRENNIEHHDGGSNKPVMLKKSMFVDNKIKIEVNKDKAGQYENGVYYVNAVESFMNTLSSSPFVGANFIDIPVMPKPLVEDEDQLVSAGIRTWFTDYKNRQERVVRNSLASSYVNLFPTTINFYDYSTKDTEHPVKLRESAYLVSTFGQEINGMDMGNSYEISNYEFVTADPEELTITQQDGNIINLYYNRISSDADFYEPIVEKEEVNYGGEVDLTDNVTNLDELPTGTEVKDITPEGVIDTTQPGEYEGTIEITYPDGTSETIKVPVEVVDNRSDVDKYEPVVEKEEVNYGGEVDLTDNVTNLDELPTGTEVKDITPEGVIDTTQPGEYEGTIEITYPDGSSVIVEIPVTVKDKVDWVDINPIPTIGEDQILPEVVHKGEEADLTDNIINLPEGSTVEVVTPVDTDQVGEQTGKVKVTFPDGSSVIIEIPVTIKDNNNLSSTNKQYPVVLDVVRKNKNIDLSNATLKEDSIISKTDNKVLPQTGENDNSFFSILGMTLISVSSLLFGLFRKKEEK